MPAQINQGLVLRSVKGEPLTHEEMDNNFLFLSEIADEAGAIATKQVFGEKYHTEVVGNIADLDTSIIDTPQLVISCAVNGVTASVNGTNDLELDENGNIVQTPVSNAVVGYVAYKESYNGNYKFFAIFPQVEGFNAYIDVDTGDIVVGYGSFNGLFYGSFAATSSTPPEHQESSAM